MDSGTADNRQLPHNLEAERAVLGSIMINPESIGSVFSILPSIELFFKRTHQELYGLLLELFDQNTPIDLMIVLDALETRNMLDTFGGRTAVMDLMAIDSSAHADYYAEIVRQRAVARSVIGAGKEIARAGLEESHDIERLLDHCEKTLYEVSEERVSAETHSITDLVRTAMNEIEEATFTQGGVQRGLPTGYVELDQLTAGLHRGELAILAARPSMGKTSLAVNICERVALSGVPVAIFSLEVARDQLVRNMLCSLARVNSHDLRTGSIGPKDYDLLCRAAGQLEGASLLINDTPGITVMGLRTAARRLKKKNDIGLIMVDYLQLMEGSNHSRREGRQQEVTEISRGLKALARELEVPVLALSQLNRKVDDRENHRPRMSDLRESGSIEQEADLIMFLYRDEYYYPDSTDKQGVAEVIISKQRHGPVGSLELQFTKEYMRFERLHPYLTEGY